MIDTPNELKITLAAARVNKNMSQQEVATMLKIAKSTLIAWEKGRSAPSVLQADELCRIYERPRDSIFFGPVPTLSKIEEAI